MAIRSLESLTEVELLHLVGAIKESTRMYCKNMGLSMFEENYNLYAAIDNAFRCEHANAKFLKEENKSNA